MGTLIQDLRYALRQIRRNPGYSALAVMTLALGIAANSTIFSWIHATLLNPIPGVADSGSMITIARGERSDHPTPPFSYMDYVGLRDGVTSVTGLLAYHDDFMAITGSGKPERVYGALASSNYFEVLGVHPILGRTLLPTQVNERAGAAEVVIGYDFWKHRFDGDPAIVGKTIQLNLHTYTIVGVAPRYFRGCKSGLRTELWMPLGMDRQVFGHSRPDDPRLEWLNLLGVVRPGVDRHQVDKELNVVMQRIAAADPENHQGPNTLSTDPLWRSPFGANVYFAETFSILEALAALLLLLACANVGNLLLVRSVARRRELAIRLSMGAGRWKLVRQLMVENLVIALAGGVAAIAVTYWTAQTLGLFFLSATVPLVLNGNADSTVLVATIAVSILTAVISGALPAWRATRLSPATVLKEESLSSTGGISRSRLSSSLVVFQVALSLSLLTCAGLFIKSLHNALSVDPGFDASNVLLATFDLDPMGYTRRTGVEFEREVLDRVRHLPGVKSAALADFAPLNFTIHADSALPEGYVPHAHEMLEVDRGFVSSGYLEALRTPLLAGRDFTGQDTATSLPVAIVNQAFVDRYWPGQNAVGKHIQVEGTWRTIVGVAANGKYRSLNYDFAPLFLLPLMQRYESQVILQVRVTGDPLAYAPAIERTVHDLNGDLPLYNVVTLEDSMQMGSVFQRILVTFSGSFGMLALSLAAVGLYGVIAYTTRQRTHEIGIRMALGAAKGNIFRQVLGQGFRLALSGLILGLVVTFMLTRSLRGMLYGVGTADWLTFATVAILLCAVAFIASFIPARRAASVEPMEALRAD